MIRGSASIDTGRWANKDVEFQKKINFPTILSTKIDMKKVVFDAIKPWIKQEIDASLGFEDDVVINLVYNLLQTEQFPDGKALAVKLMGFLEADTMSFMQTLWTHLVDANNTKLGISTQLLKDAQQKQKIKKEQKIQKMERFQLKQEIEQKINPFPHRGNGGHSSYPKHDRIKRENQHELKKEHPHHQHHHHHQRHNRHHHRYEPSQRDSFRHPRRSRYHDERSHSPCDNNPRATSHEQQRDHDHEPRDSMNSVWPPSPSPPAILNEKRNCQTVVKQSPSPPRQIKEEKQDNDRSDRRKSSDIIQPKSILKHSSASARKKRDKRSVPRSISSRSYSRSPSRSKFRSRSRSRSRSSSRSSSLYDRNKSSKGKYERRTRRRHYRNDRRSYSRSADRSRSRSRSRSYSNSSDRGRWKS